jgi:hypothetical protein
MLIFKKIAEEYLETQGFDKLSVSRNGYGFIQIVGKVCEKPVAVFMQVPVSTKLTKMEREILMDEYLKPYVTSYAKELREFVVAASDNTTNDAAKRAEEALQHAVESSKTINEVSEHWPRGRVVEETPDGKLLNYLKVVAKGEEEELFSFLVKITVCPATKNTSLCVERVERPSGLYTSEGVSQNLEELKQALDNMAEFIKNNIPDYFIAEYANITHNRAVGELQQNLKEKCAF